MSLLMQALKKAERARQSGLHVDDAADGTHDLPDAPAASDAEADGPVAADAPAAPAPAAKRAGGLELSLEPIEEQPASPARAEPPPPPPSPPSPAAPAPAPIEPAVEAAHNPVPPQARHESVRARVDPDQIPVTDPRPAARPAGSEPPRRGPGTPERRATPRTTAAQAENTSGFDMARLRIAGLSGLLVLVAATFGYLYWQAVTGPGPGASLPMVPMPPPSATGATTAGGDGGIVVAPAGPPFGPLGSVDAPPAATSQGVPAEPPPPPPAAAAPAPAEPAPAPAPAPATSRAQRAPLATAAQLAAIEDPAVRVEAMRDAAERAERAARGQADVGALPGGGTSADYAAAGAPGAPGSAAPVSGAPAGDVHVARGTSAPGIHPGVQAGYQAFGAGDLAAARQHYAAALRQDPNNRDALLGSAAVALRERRDDEAAGYYARILAANPRDTEAIAGLTSLRPGDGDRAEVRLRGVLRNNPDAAPVHFALGNLYARQGRWQEAQQAYFRAWTAAPANADYAFNLAVGLDRLNQGRLAREYYERALALAAGGTAAFDRAAVQRRLLELASAQPAAAPALPAPAAAPAGN